MHKWCSIHSIPTYSSSCRQRQYFTSPPIFTTTSKTKIRKVNWKWTPKIQEGDALKQGFCYLLRICYILIISFWFLLKGSGVWGGYFIWTNPYTDQYRFKTLHVSGPQKVSLNTSKGLQGSHCYSVSSFICNQQVQFKTLLHFHTNLQSVTGIDKILGVNPEMWNKQRKQDLTELTAWAFWFGGIRKMFWICIMAAIVKISWEQPKLPEE